jgi:trigger factor
MDYTVKELAKIKDEYKFEISLNYSQLLPFKDKAFTHLASEVKVAGFRPGKAPKTQIEAKLGSKLVTQALNLMLPEIAIEFMEKENYKPAFAPNYNLKEIDQEKGIIFDISFVQYPEVKLGDFSKINLKKEEPNIEQKDIDSVIRSVIKSSVPVQKIQELTVVKLNKSPEKSKEQNDLDQNNKDDKAKPTSKLDDELGEFELNDKLVEELKYEKEKTLEELRTVVRERLKKIKDQQAEDEYLSKLVKEAVKVSKLEIPNEFLTREINSYEAQFKARLEELKLDLNTYLATQGSSLDEQKKKWEIEAKDKIAMDLVLIALADEHKQVASDEEVDEEIEKITDSSLKESYSNSSSAKEYVRTVITRQRGLQKLKELVAKA